MHACMHERKKSPSEWTDPFNRIKIEYIINDPQFYTKKEQKRYNSYAVQKQQKSAMYQEGISEIILWFLKPIVLF